jgi:hypothetical protein
MCRSRALKSIPVSRLSGDHRRNLGLVSVMLRTVRPESETTSQYLSPVLPNQPDSGDRGHGRNTHLVCHQYDYTCGIAAASFVASDDMTGAMNDWVQRGSGRSHRRGLVRRHPNVKVSDHGFDGCRRSNSEHALSHQTRRAGHHFDIALQ